MLGSVMAGTGSGARSVNAIGVMVVGTESKEGAGYME